MTNHEISFMPFKRDIRSKGIKTASSSLPGETDYDADQDIRMDVGKMDVFNYALYQNGIPPVRGIRIFNNTGLPVDGLSMRISSDFAFFHPYEAALPQVLHRIISSAGRGRQRLSAVKPSPAGKGSAQTLS